MQNHLPTETKYSLLATLSYLQLPCVHSRKKKYWKIIIFIVDPKRGFKENIIGFRNIQVGRPTLHMIGHQCHQEYFYVYCKVFHMPCQRFAVLGQLFYSLSQTQYSKL